MVEPGEDFASLRRSLGERIGPADMRELSRQRIV
jgi:hypothetical protein